MLAALFDGLAMSKHKFAELERLERFGNIARTISAMVSSALFLIWVALREYQSDELFPHFVTLCLAAAVFMGWAAWIEQKRWKKVRAPWATRAASLVGTPGLMLLECGLIVWAVSDPDNFLDFVPYTVSIYGALYILILSFAGLLYLLWKQRHDRGEPSQRVTRPQDEEQAV